MAAVNRPSCDFEIVARSNSTRIRDVRMAFSSGTSIAHGVALRVHPLGTVTSTYVIASIAEKVSKAAVNRRAEYVEDERLSVARPVEPLVRQHRFGKPLALL